MRLSDAGLRRRQTKARDPNHRPPPWPIEDATVHTGVAGFCTAGQHHNPTPVPHRFAQFYGNRRCRGNADRDGDLNRRIGMLRQFCESATANEVALIRPTKCACSGAAATRTTWFARPARRPTHAQDLCWPSWHLTINQQT
jgi:hypothetical protein